MPKLPVLRGVRMFVLVNCPSGPGETCLQCDWLLSLGEFLRHLHVLGVVFLSSKAGKSQVFWYQAHRAKARGSWSG